MFIGRKREIQILKDIFSSSGPSISIVYGRRRIGKSSLIEQAAKGYKFYSFEGLEDQPTAKQQAVLVEQLRSCGVSFDEGTTRDWYNILSSLILLAGKTEPTIILLDEFQWLANYRSELVSNLKLVWDQILIKNPNIKLVLCGSVASFMVRKVIRSKALYGRVNTSINLKPFNLNESVEMFKHRSLDEAILGYLLVGGVPKYLDLLNDRDSVLRSMAHHCSDAMSYFVSEYQKIFVSHFGRKQDYLRLIRFLVNKSYGASRRDIIQALKLPNSGQTSELMEDLEYAGFIHSYVPFDKKTSSTEKRFYLADYYLRFYLTFLEPLILNGELERVDFINQIFNSAKMNSWLGYGFELLCLDHVPEIADLLGFSAVRYKAGPYFRSEASGSSVSRNQLDLVFDRSDKVSTVCEIKYQENVNISEAGKQLTKTIEQIPYFKNRTVQKVLIVSGDIDDSKNNHQYFSRIVNIREIVGDEK